MEEVIKLLFVIFCEVKWPDEQILASSVDVEDVNDIENQYKEETLNN